MIKVRGELFSVVGRISILQMRQPASNMGVYILGLNSDNNNKTKRHDLFSRRADTIDNERTRRTRNNKYKQRRRVFRLHLATHIVHASCC